MFIENRIRWIHINSKELVWHTWQTKVKGNKIKRNKYTKSGFSVKRVKKQFCRTKSKNTSSNKKTASMIHSNSSIDENRVYWDQYTKVVQAKKSIWRMPWHWEPMKDVTSCDKLRWAANKLRPADFRMWEHLWWRIIDHILNQIGIWGEPPELKHLSRGRKRNQTRFCE